MIRILVPTVFVLISALFLLFRHWHDSSSDQLIEAVEKIKPATQEALEYLQRTRYQEKSAIRFELRDVRRFYRNSGLFTKINNKLADKLVDSEAIKAAERLSTFHKKVAKMSLAAFLVRGLGFCLRLDLGNNECHQVAMYYAEQLEYFRHLLQYWGPEIEDRLGEKV